MNMLRKSLILTLLLATTAQSAHGIKLRTILLTGATIGTSVYLYRTYTAQQTSPQGTRSLALSLSPYPEKPLNQSAPYRPLVLAENPDIAHLNDLKLASLQLDSKNNTLLHLAALSGNTKLAKSLVEEFGADAEAKNADGESAIDCAYKAGHKELAKLLMPKSER
ncbi:MAG: hypothetical protein QG632_631 [Candidatus Dependentiae bacterium]|nr:hypothetical protein [Candidatus Dependentiae bacterium]